MSDSKFTIRPLNTGYIPTKTFQYQFHWSASAYLKDVRDELMALPCFTFLIEGGDKPVLVDTGMAWTERADKFHHAGSHQEEGEDIESRLKSVGYECGDIDTVIFTHLHWDHQYYAEKFKSARAVCGKRELEFALSPIPLNYKSYEYPVLGLTAPFKSLDLETVEGETEVIPGIRMFDTPGHCPGHMSVEVDCADGDSYILGGDTMLSLRCLDPVPELHYDITPPGRFTDIVASWHSIELEKERAKDRDHLLITHDITLPERLEKTPVIGA